MSGNHLKHMLVGGAGLFGVLLLAGVSLQTALTFAVALACPLMMVFMMGGHGGHGDHGDHGGGHDRGRTEDRRHDAVRDIDPAHRHDS